jgi:hypothetical protein
MFTVFQDMHVIRPFWGGEPGETVVFDTVTVAENTKLTIQNIQMLAGSSSCKTAKYTPINSVQQDYPVGGAFWGAVPADTVVFDTAIDTVINQTEYGKLTDVGSIDGHARSQNIAQKPYLASLIAL